MQGNNFKARHFSPLQNFPISNEYVLKCVLKNALSLQISKGVPQYLQGNKSKNAKAAILEQPFWFSPCNPENMVRTSPRVFIRSGGPDYLHEKKHVGRNIN